MGWVKGQSGNKAGRPKGILDKRLRLNKSLMGQGDALLAVTTAAALAGDMTAMSLLLPRMMPTLKPEGSPIRFALDASLETSKQIEQVLQALADGQLSVEEAKHVAEMIHLLAEARSADGADESADKLNQAFRRMAQFINQNGDSLPPDQSIPEV
ncbi:MAG: DUF5681 domain-containing protein [Steroidobacteraceae bacterium]